jgi:hypothetical protein
MMSLPSNIRVSIQFKNSIVFAGEDVECIITFKNAASRPTASIATALVANTAPRRRRQSLQSSAFALPPSQPKASRSDPQPAADPPVWPRAPSPRKGHGRSLSILSLASEASAPNDQSKSGVDGGSRRPHGHARSQSHNPVIGTQTGTWFALRQRFRLPWQLACCRRAVPASPRRQSSFEARRDRMSRRPSQSPRKSTRDERTRSPRKTLPIRPCRPRRRAAPTCPYSVMPLHAFRGGRLPFCRMGKMQPIQSQE